MRQRPIIRQPEKEIPVEIIATAIVEVAAAARKMAGSKLTQRAIIVLIRDAEPSLALRDIELVLRTAGQLDARYIKKSTAKEDRAWPLKPR